MNIESIGYKRKAKHLITMCIEAEKERERVRERDRERVRRREIE